MSENLKRGEKKNMMKKNMGKKNMMEEKYEGRKNMREEKYLILFLKQLKQI